MKFDIKTLTEMWQSNMISDTGKDRLIKLLLGRLVDYTEEIKRITGSDKFENPIGIKEANKKKDKIIQQRNCIHDWDTGGFCHKCQTKKKQS